MSKQGRFCPPSRPPLPDGSTRAVLCQSCILSPLRIHKECSLCQELRRGGGLLRRGRTEQSKGGGEGAATPWEFTASSGNSKLVAKKMSLPRPTGGAWENFTHHRSGWERAKGEGVRGGVSPLKQICMHHCRHGNEYSKSFLRRKGCHDFFLKQAHTQHTLHLEGRGKEPSCRGGCWKGPGPARMGAGSPPAVETTLGLGRRKGPLPAP